jgi:hypothetical protein
MAELHEIHPYYGPEDNIGLADFDDDPERRGWNPEEPQARDLESDALDGPLDIGAVSQALQADDGLDQEEILQALTSNAFLPGQEQDQYEKKKVFPTLLSKYRSHYLQKNGRNALAYLQNRCQVVVDDDMKVPDASLIWDFTIHRLDYMLAISNTPGLWATIPNVAADHTFIFEMDLSAPYRDFKSKFTRLGYDPTGRLLWIGRCRNENVYPAMCPREVVDGTADVDEDEGAGVSAGDTRLSAKHYRMIVMLFASLLSKLPSRSYDCLDPYGINIEEGLPAFTKTTNLL